MSLHAYQKAWLAKFAPLALANERRYQVPALFTLAQQLVESAWSLNKLGNNFFGIKAGGAWKGPSNNQKTHEYGKGGAYNTSADFRAYPSEAAAYEGHAQFLLVNPRYRPAFAHRDPLGFAYAVAHAGYATDPNYFKKLAKNIAFLQGKPLPAGSAVGIGGGLLLLAGLYFLFSNQARPE